MNGSKLQHNVINKDRKLAILISGIIIITFIAYYPTVNNGFTNWDDPMYVMNNSMIKSLSPENIKIIFTTPLSANYHPVTLLSLAINYKISKTDPTSYHVLNLLLHLCNVLFVFIFIYLLTGKKADIAAITALLFGIHPMHVESVAWIAERKDVLYTFFFLGGLIIYLRYTESLKTKHYLITLLLFVLSLLSKAVAVTFPVVLLLVDYYTQRRLTKKSIIEKIPFFAIAIVFGLITLNTQSVAINKMEDFTILQRLLIASYGFMAYIFKLFIPVNLSAYYPYPDLTLPHIPVAFYIAPALIILLCWVLYKYRQQYRSLIFGFLFYAITVALVLQLLSVGGTIISERYTYIPYIGLFFIIGWLYNHLKTKNRNTSTTFITILSGYIIVFAVVSHQRTKVWKNSETLWSDVIEKHPDVYVAYNNLGNAYITSGRYEAAKKAYKRTIELNPGYAEAYNNLGSIYKAEKQFKKAEKTYKKAIELKPGFASAYFNLGNLYRETNRHKKAISYFKKAIANNQDYAQAYNKMAVTLRQLNRPEEAAAAYKKALKVDPDFAEANSNYANLLVQQQAYEEAEKKYKKAITSNPAFAEAHCNLGALYINIGQLDKAEKETTKAIALKNDYANAYNNLGVIYHRKKEYQKAVDAFKKVIAIDPGQVKAHNNLKNVLNDIKNTSENKEVERTKNQGNTASIKKLLTAAKQFEQTNQIKKAEEKYKQILKIRPGFAAVHNNLGVLMVNARRYDEAEKAFKDAIKNNPQFTDAYINLAVSLSKVNRLAEAEKNLEKAVNIDPDNQKAQTYLKRIKAMINNQND